MERRDLSHCCLRIPQHRADTIIAMNMPRSIFARALGSEFNDLHPLIQKLFGLCSSDHHVAISEGVMEEIWHGRFYMRPFLRLGEKRNLLFAEHARDVPFTLHNYAYIDSFGRETVTWNRMFDSDPPRRFDESMIFSTKRNCVLVYAGSHQHLGVEMHIRAGDDGALHMTTGAQRLYEFRVGVRFPLLFSGIGRIRLSPSDGDRLRIDVNISNRIWGPIFGYNGWFSTRYEPCPPANIPDDVKPLREERRE